MSDILATRISIKLNESSTENYFIPKFIYGKYLLLFACIVVSIYVSYSIVKKFSVQRPMVDMKCHVTFLLFV